MTKKVQHIILRTSLRSHLTPREKSICEFVIQGYSNKEISNELGITASTVETHRANVFRKLNVHSAAELQHDYGDFFEHLNA